MAEQDADYVLSSSEAQDAPPDFTPEPSPVVPEPQPDAQPDVQPTAPSPPVPDGQDAEQRRRDAAFAAQRRRIDALEAEVQRYRQAQMPRDTEPRQPQADPNAPRPEQFPQTQEGYTQFIAALTRYQSQRAVSDYAAQQAWREQRTAWEGQEAHVRQKYQDYDAAVSALEVDFHNAILHTMHQLPNGPDIAYHLATHQDEAQRLAALPPAWGLVELGRISDRLSSGTLSQGTNGQQQPRAAPPAAKPAPPEPVGPSNGSTSTLPPDEMPYEQYVEWYEKRHGTRW